jgi:hypothetical protein
VEDYSPLAQKSAGAKANYKPFSLNALSVVKVPAVNFFRALVAAEQDDF